MPLLSNIFLLTSVALMKKIDHLKQSIIYLPNTFNQNKSKNKKALEKITFYKVI